MSDKQHDKDAAASKDTLQQGRQADRSDMKDTHDDTAAGRAAPGSVRRDEADKHHTKDPVKDHPAGAVEK